MEESNAIAGSERRKSTRMKAQARAKATRPAEEQDILANTKARFGKKVPKRHMNVSLTVGRIDADIDPSVFDSLAQFIEENAAVGMIAMERGDSQLQLHIQGVLSIKASSTRGLKGDISSAIGWKEYGPPGGSICVKSLTEKGLHTLLGMVGYCLKDENELHYRIYTKNIIEDQMDEGRRRFVMYGSAAYKSRELAEMKAKLTEISPANEVEAKENDTQVEVKEEPPELKTEPMDVDPLNHIDTVHVEDFNREGYTTDQVEVLLDNGYGIASRPTATSLPEYIPLV
ncbi:hypothetical protein R1sor_016948 [Riccia sorocarpa]|uniref:Replitron HUH endonuclease domain-containing protein n=1 Tax=Riccia sorocarpa TaxID=122646 RepID=A0ABD3I6I8_9MARC